MPMRLKSRMMAMSGTGHLDQQQEVGRHGRGDEGPQHHQELALAEEIRLAGGVDEFGDLEHAPVHGHVLELEEIMRPKTRPRMLTTMPTRSRV
jgi:hypothetical protein